MKMIKRMIWTALEMLPYALPITLAIFSAITMVFFILDKFEPTLIWPTGLLASFFGLAAVFKERAVVEYHGTIKERRLFDLVAVAGIIVWVFFNVGYTSRNVFVYRDPAVYNVTAAILIEEKSLDIEKTASVFGNNPNLTNAGSGFAGHEAEPDKIFAHGQHLLPALMAFSGQIIGESKMFNTNLIFGGIAIMSVYGFARLIMKPRWAMLAATTTAVSLPMLYFSRDSYTEPLAMAFTFGGLTLLWMAHNSERRALWFLTGIMAGAGLLTRIDAYLVIAGIVAGIGAILIFSSKNKRKPTLYSLFFFLAGLLPLSLLGWLDLSVTSRAYFDAQQPLILKELKAIFSISVLVFILVLLSWKSRVLKRIDRATSLWRKPGLMVVASLLVVIVVARPLWYPSGSIAYEINNIGGVQATEVFDLNEGYNGSAQKVESITSWIKWYLGPIVAYLGAIGFVLYVGAAAATKKNIYLLPGLFVFLATALVFLIEPSITPDQIWAVRRLLPVVIPFVAIFAAYTLGESEKIIKLPLALRSLLFLVATIAVLWSPVVTSASFIKTRERATQLGQVYSVCNNLPEDAAVLWVGLMGIIGAQTIDAFCDVPSVAYKGVPSGADLAKAAESARKQGYNPVVGLISQDIAHLPPGSSVVEVSNVDYLMIEKVFYTPPKKVITTTRAISIGNIAADGTVKGY